MNIPNIRTETLHSLTINIYRGSTLALAASWLRIYHKVSLVGRHESNGTEGSNKQFLRHLRTLILDERLYDSWSDDTVLPLINLHLASYPTAETGGYTPLQLKYGTDANCECKLVYLPVFPMGRGIGPWTCSNDGGNRNKKQ